MDNFFSNPFFAFYSILISTYILSRFLLAYFHISTSHNPNYEPTVTFVVPAKNEEENIGETLRRFKEVNYPLQKLEVIAVNDGSTDNTLVKMQLAQQEIGSEIRIKIIDWKENKGKREAMAEGIKRANHEIIIFIDSDSFIEKNCVKHLVKYFSNKKVGAVCGHTDVYNSNTNLLTQMQAIRYFIAFKIYKSAESIFGNVTCCPGCCSAYRRKYVLKFLNLWLNQTFLRNKCTFGDDRSLTNFILRKYDAVYSSQAKAYTIVPDTFKKYIKQQQRWKKSWVRETFIACSFIWKKNKLAAVSFYAYVFLALISPIVFFRAMIWTPYMSGKWPLEYLFGLFLMLFLHGIYYRREYKTKRCKSWILAIMSFWLNTVLLMWQLPWAIVTINKSHWGTR